MMRRRGIVAMVGCLVVASGLACGACSGDSTQAPDATRTLDTAAEVTAPIGGDAIGGPTFSGPEGGTQAAARQASRRVHIHPTLPEYTFTVVGGGVGGGPTIEIQRDNSATPIQVIEGLDTSSDSPEARSAEMPALDVLDMNFDGYSDFRFVELRPAGPNVPYRNWLFDPASGRFIESEALNAITSPQFDAAAREVRSEWRDGPVRYGTDVYAYGEGGLAPVRKEIRTYTAPGRHTIELLRRVNGVWKVAERRTVREP